MPGMKEELPQQFCFNDQSIWSGLVGTLSNFLQGYHLLNFSAYSPASSEQFLLISQGKKVDHYHGTSWKVVILFPNCFVSLVPLDFSLQFLTKTSLGASISLCGRFFSLLLPDLSARPFHNLQLHLC